jgi:hypothetical protein
MKSGTIDMLQMLKSWLRNGDIVIRGGMKGSRPGWGSIKRQRKGPVLLAFGAELLLLALLAFRKWPHLPANQMPFAKLSVCDKCKWLEAICRL